MALDNDTKININERLNEFSYAVKKRISPLSVVIVEVELTKTSKLGNIIWIILLLCGIIFDY